MRRPCNRVHGRFAVVRNWPLWSLPAWVVAYITLVVLAEVTALTFAVRVGFGTSRDILFFAGMLAGVAATVELTRRLGSAVGVTKDVLGVWQLPAAILLPPVYALAIPIVRTVLIQFRILRAPVHRRAFSASAIGLSYGAAALAFHAMMGTPLGTWTDPSGRASVWMLAAAVGALLQWGVNNLLLVPAVKGADRDVDLRAMFAGREPIQNDAAELCVSVLVTTGIAGTPVTFVFALPFVTLLQRSFRHQQLVNASRLDSKTGLLNAGTWEREASAEVARAIRTHSPLAVALIDLDHFKAVNDAYGHLAGDKVLQSIARTLTGFLREYDLVGRFGGEEFALLLPQTKALDAYRIAERIRAYIGGMPIDVSNDPKSEPIKVTVSIGVAALGSQRDASPAPQVTDLLAAADTALYQAKQDGRDQVCVVTGNAALTTVPQQHMPESLHANGHAAAPPAPKPPAEPLPRRIPLSQREPLRMGAGPAGPGDSPLTGLGPVPGNGHGTAPTAAFMLGHPVPVTRPPTNGGPAASGSPAGAAEADEGARASTGPAPR